uniref:Uncharacterized protein n=1 Tax=Triticum urartu TaxID=4572 RepID=A0A8R7V2L4_TRIUA
MPPYIMLWSTASMSSAAGSSTRPRSNANRLRDSRTEFTRFPAPNSADASPVSWLSARSTLPNSAPAKAAGSGPARRLPTTERSCTVAVGGMGPSSRLPSRRRKVRSGRARGPRNAGMRP